MAQIPGGTLDFKLRVRLLPAGTVGNPASVNPTSGCDVVIRQAEAKRQQRRDYC